MVLGALLGDLAVMYDDDPVSRPGLGQSVGDRERGATTYGLLRGAFEDAGTGRASLRSGLVHHDERTDTAEAKVMLTVRDSVPPSSALPLARERATPGSLSVCAPRGPRM